MLLTILNISVILIAKTDEMELDPMAIGERIHFFRTMRGMTQKYLGMLLGFPEKSADVRLAQYETGARTPNGAKSPGKYLVPVARGPESGGNVQTKLWSAAHSRFKSCPRNHVECS